jgi:phosphomannomutase
MNRVFMFDVDGTLTNSRCRMNGTFEKFFYEWAKKNTFYLVTGSDMNKLMEQVPDKILDCCEGIFVCAGNEFWEFDPHIVNFPFNQVYRNTFKPPENLLTYLGEQLRFSDYHHRAGNHIENRGSMLNFSIVGRNCSKMERENYFDYDNEIKERETISEYIRNTWKDLDASIGGQISIDIYPKGFDKSQILEHIIKRNKADEYIFVGDKMREGGNDYPLAELMYKTDKCSACQTMNPNTTQQLLEAMND